MGMYAVQTADAGDLVVMSEAARDSRAVAIARRRALAGGKSALPAANDRVRNGYREAKIPAPAGPLDAAPAVSSNGQAPPSAAPPSAVPSSAAPVAAHVAAGVSDAHVGRAMSMQRRRQLSQGKHALGGAAAAARPEAPAVATTAAAGTVADAHLGRSASIQRRRQQSLGSGALAAPAGPPSNAGAPAAPAPEGTSAPARSGGAVADAHLGRSASIERRRRLSQGKAALTGAIPAGAVAAPVVAQSLEATPSPSPSMGREQARARRAAASRGSEALSRPQPEGQVSYAPKVIVSPTHGGQRVTGLRIGTGVQVTGGEAGAALPVSGTQYVAADGPPAVQGGGQKVGLTRTAQGLTVSGTAVRNGVAITGDEVGEHLRITGQADQKLEDDLTSRSDGSFRPAQFPRRANPHGAAAVGTRPTSAVQPGQPLETTTGGLKVSGTAVGLGGRVTGNEAGSSRPITGDQYAGLASTAGTSGATASAYAQGRLDPVTGGKVTVAQTWNGQRVTGPSVEHRPNVTGDEPGSCRPVTGTPYQGPSTAFGWCEPGEGDGTAQRLDPTARGVAVSGDVPTHSSAVTGTARGHGRNVTGTAYYGDMRAAQAAADDWTGSRTFPVALARRLAGQESTGDAKKESGDVRLPPSGVPGRITGSFAYGDGKVTGNQEFLFRARPARERKESPVTGEGRTEGRTITGSSWTANDRVTGTEGYIAAGRNPSQGGGDPHGWAGASKFRDKGTSAGPRQIVTGLSGSSPKAASKITLSGGAQG